MKKKLFLVLAISLALTGLATGGSVTDNLSVSGTLAVACQIFVTPVDFGNLDPSGGTAQGDITVNCSPGTSYTIALDAGQHLSSSNPNLRQMALDEENLIGYLLSKDSGSNWWGDDGFGNTITALPLNDTGNGANQPHTVYGTSQPFGSLLAGVYTDTVLVTVHF